MLLDAEEKLGVWVLKGNDQLTPTQGAYHREA